MFLEERLSLVAAYGAAVTPQYDVDITETQSGNEYRRLRHPFPRSVIELNFFNRNETDIMDTLLDLFHRCGGRYGGFRFQNWLDYSSNGRKGSPGYNDQACTDEGSGVYQLTKWYGTEGATDATRRRILKPEAGSVVVGIRDGGGNPHEIPSADASPQRWGWSVDTTTGQVAFSANQQAAVLNITQSAQAIVTVPAGHGFIEGDSVHFSGVSGMTEINGLRGEVVTAEAESLTVGINTSGFSAFTLTSPNGAILNASPQSGETVTAGYHYDLPVRFETDIPAEFASRNPEHAIMTAPVNLIELLNPNT